ncbi:sensor histidine kinase [Hespellia stercorisuis]|uniref:Sensor histidine kinase YesM n=1 Tax=Hespellia stercorisuis DSM 15480 TaxID=1121950 RepID=A0A1M6PI95_9FIRM|nr:sensor histidine kinase [Hespellia stercorisuis]SHK07634.1 Sensor histidine kinase YesM [Hespellia stercorisuis DSM 15480]
MTEWYKIVSCFFTNEIQLLLGLCLVAKLLNFPKLNKIAVLLSTGGSVLITWATILALPQFYLVGIEIGLLITMVCYLYREQTRICVFLIFFYEIAIALWEFLISAGLAVWLKDARFIDTVTAEYMLAVWIVRLLMLGIFWLAKRNGKIARKEAVRMFSVISLAGMFGVIVLSEQKRILLSDDRLTTWIILSLLLMMAILFFTLSRQHEMEKEIARLKEEQAELLERDYRALNRTYTSNAKLYHDIHNHIEVLHRYLKQRKTDEAIQYLEDLCSPVWELTQENWTGDEAIDYLISSKMSFAKQQNIRTKINIEFPRHTNIRNVDLTAILGNMLDNALEAAIVTTGELRFINLTIRRINNMLIVKVENGFAEKPVIAGGTLQTSKSQKALHGWGLKSALSAAERYDGIIKTSFDQHIFQTVATLSYHAV